MANDKRWPGGAGDRLGAAAGVELNLGSRPLMAGKPVLVTGDTDGIGKITATGLAAPGARVGITGRDPAGAEAAAASIRAASAVMSRAVTFRTAKLAHVPVHP